MKWPGRIQRRLSLAIVLTALIPVLAAIWLGNRYVHETGARYFVPEIGSHLDRSLGLYQELARTVKARMREEAHVIALSPALRGAVTRRDRPAAEAELERALREHPSLVSLQVRSPAGSALFSANRGHPVDSERENQLEVVRALGDDAADDDAPELLAVFVADRARFDELTNVSQFIETYKMIDARRKDDLRGYVLAFSALLGITIVAAVTVGTLLARGVASRISKLSDATQRVREGDLSTRVPEEGRDELTSLSRAFNRMLTEVQTSRARIEYLQRLSAWQEMARRLAHEIKNPLTPIQLGVQEIHRRYAGSDPEFRRLLDTTLEIVEDEVGTLRRLVAEFSEFARLPRAKLEPACLAEFLREQRRQIEGQSLDKARDNDGEFSVIRTGERPPVYTWELPESPARVALDRQMLRRVLLNLIQNAADALGEARVAAPRIHVRLGQSGDYYVLDVEDNGPGLPAELGELIFDPYVSTKSAGTGLGLAIVKKIVIEHGGMILASGSALGGARIRLTMPAAVTRAAKAGAPPAPRDPSPLRIA